MGSFPGHMKLVFVSHHYIEAGLPPALAAWLVARAEDLTVVANPLFPSHETQTTVTTYHNGELVSRISKRPRGCITVINYFWDVYYTFRYARSSEFIYDAIVAADNLNAMPAIWARRFGFTKRVIFITCNCYPNRFENRLLNWFYHRIDRYCVRHADIVWTSSDLIQELRMEKHGNKILTYAKQIPISEGVWFSRIRRKPFDQIHRHQVIYSGYLGRQVGLEEAIRAINEVRKAIPDVKLKITGKGNYETELKTLVAELGIEKYVDFTGHIENLEDVEDLWGESAVAVATYMLDDMLTRYAGRGVCKVASYLGAGLPIVLTDVPEMATDIEQAGAGIVIPYDFKEIASALIKIISNDEKLKEYRDNALRIGRTLDYETLFKQWMCASF